jgi:hypothetical protein
VRRDPKKRYDEPKRQKALGVYSLPIDLYTVVLELHSAPANELYFQFAFQFLFLSSAQAKKLLYIG